MRNVLSERFLDFAVNIFKLEGKLIKTYSGKHVYNQLFRSGTSAGANYEEASGAESKPDFVHKMQIVLKELRESFFWLRFIKKSEIIKTSINDVQLLLKENDELVRIIGKAVATSKINKK